MPKKSTAYWSELKMSTLIRALKLKSSIGTIGSTYCIHLGIELTTFVPLLRPAFIGSMYALRRYCYVLKSHGKYITGKKMPHCILCDLYIELFFPSFFPSIHIFVES